MHKYTHMLERATAIAWGEPTWLEIIASHAHLRSTSDCRNHAQHGSRTADESRK